MIKMFLLKCAAPEQVLLGIITLLIASQIPYM